MCVRNGLQRQCLLSYVCVHPSWFHVEVVGNYRCLLLHGDEFGSNMKNLEKKVLQYLTLGHEAAERMPRFQVHDSGTRLRAPALIAVHGYRMSRSAIITTSPHAQSTVAPSGGQAQSRAATVRRSKVSRPCHQN